MEPNTPSSISSSETAQRNLDWKYTWLLAVGLGVACLGGLEVGWRRAGCVPSCNDTTGLWGSRLALVYANPDALVLIGDSRTQLGIDPQVLRTVLPDRLVVQLAVPGTSPLPVLHHLAATETFCGTVLCGVNPLIFFEASRWSERPIVDRLRQQRSESWISQWEHPFRAWCQAHATILRSDLTPSEILSARLRGRPLHQPFVRIRSDRHGEADFRHDPRLLDRRRIEQEFAETFGQPAGPEQVGELLAEISTSVRAIQGRGGRVVFLAMPATGAVRDAELLRYPASSYWDRLRALPAILCLDPVSSFPASVLECADFGHLDHPIAVQFTANLGKILAAQTSAPSLR